MASDKLPTQQELFCQEYLKDNNATQAAKRAGYSEKTAFVQGPRLLGNVRVSARIQELMDARARRTQITADKVIRDIEAIRDRCMKAQPVVDAKGNPTGEWKFESQSALKACELLGKHLKMFTDKVEHSGKVGIVETMSDEELDRRLKELQGDQQPSLNKTLGKDDDESVESEKV